MSQGGCHSGRALRRTDIPPWIRVDDDGSVWTSHGQGGVALAVERRAECSDGHGYLTVRLDGVLHLAHRVVYAWVHGEVPAGLLVRHLDSSRRNNHPDNLALGDQLANMRDAVLAGSFTGDHRRGERHHKAKLTAATVQEIRAAYRAGEKQVSLAARFGVNKTGISKIVRRETWAHV